MAKAVATYPAWAVQGKTLKSGGATWTQGQFVGIDQWGDPALAQFYTPVVYAMGVALQDAFLKDPLGNNLRTIPEVSWTTQAKVSNMTTAAGSPLAPGAVYYIQSGGNIVATKPAVSAGQFNQVAGIAMSTHELAVAIGSPIVL